MNSANHRYQATQVMYRGGENMTWALDTRHGPGMALPTRLRCAINRKAWLLRALTLPGRIIILAEKNVNYMLLMNKD